MAVKCILYEGVMDGCCVCGEGEGEGERERERESDGGVGIVNEMWEHHP